MQVEEGFLDGLDIELTSGLNVLIGARGTGKTSIIELIRYCLNSASTSAEAARRSREHALSILGSGQVTITLQDGPDQIRVARTANDEEPGASGHFHPPIVFSQSEIESVGLRAGGRLQLIDAFLPRARPAETEGAVTSEIRSVTVEISRARAELERLQAETSQLGTVIEGLGKLAPEEARMATLSSDTVAKKDLLDQLSEGIATNAVRQDHLARFAFSIDQLMHSIDAVRPSARIETWPERLGPDPLGDERTGVLQTLKALGSEVARLAAIRVRVTEVSKSNEAARLTLEERARELRREIDGIEKGAGAIAREVQVLRQRKAQLEDLLNVMRAREAELNGLLSRRGAAMLRLEAIRSERFAQREQVVSHLNTDLGPRIRVGIERSGQFEQFSSAIAEALKGSGLRYNDLAAVLAQSLSPQELVEAADRNDYELLVDASGITEDRAIRALSALRSVDLGAIATVVVEDAVRLELLDGPIYKDISELSTGQRCTVVLPLVLRHTDRIVIVDQPEDHIDNAFIADTLIRSINARSGDGQMIFSTHNANIPVLGNADHVIQMSSDGRRGFASISSSLMDADVVSAISSVMEGGHEAFLRRAAFYGPGGVFD